MRSRIPRADERNQEDDEKSQLVLQARGWKLKDALNHFMDAAWKAINPKIPLVWQEMVSCVRVILFASV